MSAVPRQPGDLGHAGLRMTAEAFFALGETDERMELVDGVIIVSPSPQPLHQRVVQEVFRQFDAATMDPRPDIFLDTDVMFAANIVYRPDVAVYAGSRRIGIPERLMSPPDLVVEVLSPGSKASDLITKRDDYGRFGVGEYWAIDPSDASVQCWRRTGSQGLSEVAVTTDVLTSTAVAGLALRVGPIRALARR